MSDPRQELETGEPIVVGVGNVLLGDDGVGPAVCEALRGKTWRGSGPLPRGTRVIDGGTLGAALVPWLVDARAVAIVDAVCVPGTPGTVLVWNASELPLQEAGRAGGLVSLVATAILAGLPKDAISLIGVIPASIQPRLGLSRAVSTAVPQAASIVAQEIRKLTGGIA